MGYTYEVSLNQGDQTTLTREEALGFFLDQMNSDENFNLDVVKVSLDKYRATVYTVGDPENGCRDSWCVIDSYWKPSDGRVRKTPFDKEYEAEEVAAGPFPTRSEAETVADLMNRGVVAPVR